MKSTQSLALVSDQYANKKASVYHGSTSPTVQDAARSPNFYEESGVRADRASHLSSAASNIEKPH
jgi:hypothetical protein